MIPFQLKKFISQFLMPMPLVCECFLLGWVLHRFTKYKKTGRAFNLLAFTLFLVFGYGFGRTYLYNLERRYPPFDPTPEQCEALRGAPVVVLGQGMPLKSDLPARYQNNPVFERRLFEGVRVAKLIPESWLIVSMAGDASNSVKQAALTHYLQQLSFPTNRVTMFTTARDTAEEAKLARQVIEKCANAQNKHAPRTSTLVQSPNARLKPAELERGVVFRDGAAMRECANHGDTQSMITNAQPAASISEFTNSRTRAVTTETPIRAFEHSRTRALILATSASHLPRSMKIFQKQGLNPIASPCDYVEIIPSKLIVGCCSIPFPAGGNFEVSSIAFHEWLGGLYERLTGAK